MSCYICLITIPAIIWRTIVSMCSCIYKPRTHFKSSLRSQMQSCRSRKGGWWSGMFRQIIDTRECFYTLLGLLDMEEGREDLKLFINRLTDDMNTKGQVPSSYHPHWFRGELPRYRSNFEEVPIVDSNMFYIILLWEKHEREISVDKYYISAQRAYQFLDKYVAENTLYEPMGASWENTREHNSHLLLTNVIMARTIRCMELLALINQRYEDKRFVHTKIWQIY